MVTDHFQSLVPAIRQVVGSRPNAYALDPADIGSDNNPYTQTYEDREFWRSIPQRVQEDADRPPMLSPPEAMPRPVLGAADGGDGQPDPEPPDSTEGELVMPNTCTSIEVPRTEESMTLDVPEDPAPVGSMWVRPEETEEAL